MVLYMVRVLRKLPLWWVAQGQRRVSFGKEERAGTLSPYTSWGRSLICREIRRNTMRRIKTALDLIVKVKSLSHVRLFVTPWSSPSSSVHGILQARILEWVAISFSGDLPDSGIEPRSPTLQADALTSAPPGKALNTRIQVLTSKISREERKPGGRKKREEAGEGG